MTDMQNFIIDLALEVIEDPIALGQELDPVIRVIKQVVQMVNGHHLLD